MPRRWYENRVFRLLATLFLANGGIVFAELLAVFGLHYLAMQRLVPASFAWMELFPTVAAYGVSGGQLLMLCLVCALVERSRWWMWLAAMPFTFLLSISFLSVQLGPAVVRAVMIHDEIRMQTLSVMIVVGSFLPIILCYGGVLLASVMLWPLKIFAGWHVTWHDDPVVSNRTVHISHLMLWIGLWAALFLLATRSAERFGETGVLVAIGGSLVILFTGLPIVFVLGGQRWTALGWCGLLAYLVTLSYGESTIIYWYIKPPFGFTTVMRVLSIVLCFNVPLLAVMAMNCLLLRGQGLRLNMPLPWFRKSPAGDRASVAVTPGP